MIAAGLTVLLGLVGAVVAAPAHAVTPSGFSISPESGPTAGGTVVTVTPPQGVGFTSVSAHIFHSLAVGSDGNAYAWGSDEYGRLGNGPAESSPVPVKVSLPEGVDPEEFEFVSVAAGQEHSLALGSDGNVYAWGRNVVGQLGNGVISAGEQKPVKVVSPGPGITFTSVAAGAHHSLAIGSDDRAYAWGWDLYGQLGDDVSRTNKAVPEPVVSLGSGVTVASVSAGEGHSLATGSDGRAYAWGWDLYGQLGDGGANTDQPVPVPVAPLGGAGSGITVTSVSAGGSHSLAIGSDDRAYSWGRDETGQLGDGGLNANRPVPVPVAPLGGAGSGITVTSVSAGGHHSLAIGSDGRTYAWGSDSDGQLGNGAPNVEQPEPVQVSQGAGITFESVSGGVYHSLAVGSDSSTYAWGWDDNGQLGDGGSNLSTSAPVTVVPPEVALTGVVVTSVSFDGVAGTGLAYDADAGVWTVVTPAHAAGPVDVVVEWTLGGVGQSPVTLSGGFTFEAPVAVPGAPTGLAASPRDGGADLSWTAPLSDGGAAVTDYVVEYRETPSGDWAVFADGTSTDPSATVTGLTNGTEYEFRVSAVNSAGTGPASDVATATPAAVPGAPTGLAASPRDGGADLSWTAPLSDGGAAVTDYVVEYRETPSGDWAVFADGTSTDPSATVTGLTNGTEYEFRVSAVNSAGTGPASDVATATPVATPAPPTGSCAAVLAQVRQILADTTMDPRVRAELEKMLRAAEQIWGDGRVCGCDALAEILQAVTDRYGNGGAWGPWIGQQWRLPVIPITCPIRP